MALTTLRPNGDNAVGTITGGDASRWEAVNDSPDNDATYISRTGGITSPHIIFDFTTITLPAFYDLLSVVPRIRARVDGPPNTAFDWVDIHISVTEQSVGGSTISTISHGLRLTDLGSSNTAFTECVWPPVNGFITTQTELDGVQITIDVSRCSANLPQLLIAEVYLDVNYNVRPAVTIVGPADDDTAVAGNQVTTTSRPVASWTTTDTDGDAQASAEVKWFTSTTYSATGFDPTTSVPETSATITTTGATTAPPVDLVNGTTYRQYIRASDTYGFGAWSFREFTMALVQPAAPEFSATFEGSGVSPYGPRVRLDLISKDNQLNRQDSSFEDEAAGVGNWEKPSNTTLSRTTDQAAEGLASLALTTVQAGPVHAFLSDATRSVLSTAQALWLAKDYVDGETILRDRSGNKHDLVFPGGVNDPIWLPYTGIKYLYLSGITGNHASTPTIAANTITGDIEIEIDVALDDWTPAATQTLLSHFGTGNTGSERSWRLGVNTNGTLFLQWTTDGSTLVGSTSTVSIGLADKQRAIIRVRHDVDNGTGSNTVTFHMSTDGGLTFTQIGAVNVHTGVTSHFATTYPFLEVGTRQGGTEPLAGKVYRARIRNGIGGTVAADFNPTLATEPWSTFVAATGETWTINRSTTTSNTARSVLVDRSLLLFGGNRWLQLADDPAFDAAVTQGFTVLGVFRHFGAASTITSSLIVKRATLTNSADPGWALAHHASVANVSFAEISDGTNETGRTPDITGTDGIVNVFGLRRDIVADTVASYTNGTISNTADTTTATLDSPSQLRIGSEGNGGNYGVFEFLAAAFFRYPLTTAEMDQARDRLRELVA